MSKNEDIPINADTTCDTEIQITTDFITETYSPVTETTAPVESETEEISFNAERQRILDELSSELAAWIDQSTPMYKKEAETDSDGNEISSPESFKPPVAFYYMDLETGDIMEYNSEYVFYTASVIKAPYVLWALTEIENAELTGDVKDTKFDVDKLFIYTQGTL